MSDADECPDGGNQQCGCGERQARTQVVRCASCRMLWRVECASVPADWRCERCASGPPQQHPSAALLGLPNDGSDPVLAAYGLGYAQGRREAASRQVPVSPPPCDPQMDRHG